MMAEKNLHSLLQRQLRRYIKSDLGALPKDITDFIQAVNSAYMSADEDRKMLERIMELNSQELLQVNSEMAEIYKVFPDQFFRIDENGFILSYQAGGSSDLFMPDKNILGKKFQDVFYVDVSKRFESAIKNIQHGKELVSLECSILNNKTQHYEARFVPLLEDNIFVIVRNVTQRKKDREIILQAKKDAEAANLAKSQFLANMSHELRTPLNIIIGYSELLQDDMIDMEKEEITSDLEKIVSSSNHLLNLINDVLDLTKIEAKKMKINCEVFSISPLIIDIETSIKPLLDINANNFKIICSENIGYIYSDAIRLKQIFYNLLSNACKFTEQGQIIFEVSRHNPDWIEFVIRDTGIGITSDDIKRLFFAFTQVDESSTRKYSGTGLGLSITKQLVELLGGTILVESKLGKGSTFIVRLPSLIPEEK